MNRIDRYPILGLLGQGGMARVFKVQIPVVEKIVALKLLWPHPTLEDLMGRETLKELFTTEAAILGGLQHPHVVGIWDFNTWRGRPYYLMEYHAANLAHLIGESPRPDDPSRIIPVERALDYTRQILVGLDRLHHGRIIHRDIKPHNMLIHGIHQIKIADFGLSRRHNAPFRGPAHLKVGSPGYAAPEQADNPDAAGVPADLFSVGAILYRLLTGHLPEPGTPAPPLAGRNPDLDPAWDRFLAAALAVRPEKRFASAGEMGAALAELARHWRRSRDRTCSLDEPQARMPAGPDSPEPPSATALRRTPLKVNAKHARQAFELDQLWRPRVYTGSTIRPITGDLLQDETSGLTWQQSGSRYACTWQEAQSRIKELNARNWADRTDWRLPTIAQLASLLRPLPQGRQLCLAPAFDTRQTRLWSADRRSATSAWYVDLELGFIGWLDFTAHLDVRAVSSGQASPA